MLQEKALNTKLASRRGRRGMDPLGLGLLPAFLVLVLSSMPGAVAGEEPPIPDSSPQGEEYEPPPEGFEERHYSISDLIASPQDFPDEGDPLGMLNAAASGFSRESTRKLLEPEAIMQTLKTCVAPESWRKHGPARMGLERGQLLVLQKKEVHEEISQVLKWLREGVAVPFRATVMVVTLKPESKQKFLLDPRPLTGEELIKKLEEFGELGNMEPLEFRGLEGQEVRASSVVQQAYIRDYDVSGGVYDPVMQNIFSGLRINLLVERSPDCGSVVVQLHAAWVGEPTWETARLEWLGTPIQEVPEKEQPKKEEEQKEEKKEPGSEPKGRLQVLAKSSQSKVLPLALPSRTAAVLHALQVAAQGKFYSAGTLDLSLARPEARAQGLMFFVRASVGSAKVPTLEKISGLKPGELFRLYPIRSLSFPLFNQSAPYFVSTHVAAAGGNAFGAAPSAFAQDASLLKTQRQFQEKVRQDKIVEPLGPVLFTRLDGAAHQKLTEALTANLGRRIVPLRLHALALAVEPETVRKEILEETPALDAAAMYALTKAKGTTVLADQMLCLAMGQRTFALAAHIRDFLADYDISGDAHDPVIRSLLEQGYVLEALPNSTAESKSCDLELKFQLFPSAAKVEKTALETHTVLQGAATTFLLELKAGLHLPKFQMLDLGQTLHVPFGRYTLAGARALPAGEAGKPESRHVMLWVKVEPAGP